MLLIMNTIWVLFVLFCFWVPFGRADVNTTDEYNVDLKEKKLELFPPHPTYAGQTRMPRTFFKKLHSGAAFLAGLKLGTILSKKGFELGHGKIASQHSFQIFGKSVNSAMSLSYGSPDSLLPLVDDAPDPEGSDQSKRAALKKKEEKCFQVTVIENNSKETEEKLKAFPLKVNDKEAYEVDKNVDDKRVKENVVMLFQDFEEEKPEEEMKLGFSEDHNKRVKEFNESIKQRRNNKF